MQRTLKIIFFSLMLAHAAPSNAWPAPLRTLLTSAWKRCNLHNRITTVATTFGLVTAANCPRLPAIDPEETPAPLKANFKIYGRGTIKCDPDNPACAKKLSLWARHGHDFAQCLYSDFARGQQPRSTACQATFNALDIHMPEPADRRLPVTGISKAQWKAYHNPQTNSADITFNLHGYVQCKENDVHCNNALYLLSKTSKDFSRCAKERINNHEQKPDAACYSLFSLLERSGPDVSTWDHIPVKFDRFDVEVGGIEKA